MQPFQVLGAMVNVSMLLLACLSFVTMTELYRTIYYMLYTIYYMLYYNRLD